MRSTSLDLTAAEVVADPYPFLAEERSRGPVAWSEQSASYLTFDHATAGAVLRDRRLGRIWKDREPAARLEPFNLLHRHQMMENEPPDHTRLRRLVVGAFNRGHVERLRPRVREIATRLLDAVDPRGFDVVGDYAEPLPVLVIAELLGVDTELAPRLREWSQAIVRMYEVAPERAGAGCRGGRRGGVRGSGARPGPRACATAAARPGVRPGRSTGGGGATERGRGGRLGGAAAQRRPRGVGQRLRQRAGGDAACRGSTRARGGGDLRGGDAAGSTPRSSCSSGPRRRPSTSAV